MMKQVASVIVLIVASLLAISWASSLFSGAISVSANALPFTPEPTEEESWIWLDLPPDATQLDHGKEVYRLVCSP